MVNNMDNRVDEILKNSKFNLFIKRLFDILASLFGILVMAIPMIIISIAIKLDSKGPVFFKQKRVKKNNKDFTILKFRTMVVDAPKLGMAITVGDDPRITKVGKFLRKTKLDEFPQLFNVLVGDMSFVGPRPEVRKYVDMYSDSDRDILKIRPGITDLASIKYRDESEILDKSDNPEKTYVEEIMPNKIELNKKYIENINLLNDIKIILQTLKIL